MVLLPPTFCIDGPAVGRVLYSQSVIDHINHGTCNRNVHASFKSQTSRFLFSSPLLCPSSLLSNPEETLVRPGWQSPSWFGPRRARHGSSRSDLEQIVPMKKVRGSTLHCFSMLVRETLKVDQCILCNSCWLCRGCKLTRLLPYGWHKDYCAASTQLCTSVLSRISGLCNDCIRLVTNIRTVQHAGLTVDGLLGVRLVIYIGMLANHLYWNAR